MMDIKQIGQAIAKLGLPLIGTALMGPGGTAIGAALAQAIGSDDSSPDAILSHLGQDADAVQKAREFELMHEATLLRIAVDAEKAASEEATKRWQSDMSSDSWLSKNIRPMTLIFILAVYSLFALMSAFGKPINEAYVTLLGQWGMLVMSAYFVGRSIVQGIEVVQKAK